ncbi:MAG TPA: NAD(P)H-dependent oxidoreductase subunit E, partial [Caldimonas sp.]
MTVPGGKVMPIQPLPHDAGAARRRKRQGPKGRQVDLAALDQVRRALGPLPLRRDLLIEHLHAIQDAHRQLTTAHLAALAQLLHLAQTEVFEVASFYHHFDIVRENPDGGFDAPPRITVRVCEGLSCELAGARDLLRELPGILRADVRVVAAPCVGRCEQAPVAVVHQNAIGASTCARIAAAVAANDTAPRVEPHVDLAAYRAAGGYRLLADCLEGRREVESVL